MNEWCQSIVNFTFKYDVSVYKKLHDEISICDELFSFMKNMDPYCTNIFNEHLHNVASSKFVNTAQAERSYNMNTQHIYNTNVLKPGNKVLFDALDDIQTFNTHEEIIRDFLRTSGNAIKSFSNSINKKVRVDYKKYKKLINASNMSDQSVIADTQNESSLVSVPKRFINIQLKNCRVVSNSRSVIPNCVQFEFVSGSRIMFFCNGSIQIILGKKHGFQSITTESMFVNFLYEMVTIMLFLSDLCDSPTIESVKEVHMLVAWLHCGKKMQQQSICHRESTQKIHSYIESIMEKDEISNRKGFESYKYIINIIKLITECSPVFQQFKTKSMNIKYNKRVATVSYPRQPLTYDKYVYNRTTAELASKLNFFKGSKCNGIGLNNPTEITQVMNMIDRDSLSTASKVKEAVLEHKNNPSVSLLDCLAKSLKVCK